MPRGLRNMIKNTHTTHIQLKNIYRKLNNNLEKMQSLTISHPAGVQYSLTFFSAQGLHRLLVVLLVMAELTVGLILWSF